MQRADVGEETVGAPRSGPLGKPTGSPERQFVHRRVLLHATGPSTVLSGGHGAVMGSAGRDQGSPDPAQVVEDVVVQALWKCPKCGRRFANRNQWHSCGSYTVAQHTAGRDPHVIALYEGFSA